MEESAPHDAHVVAANKVFRDVGFALAAMQFPRPANALSALKRWHNVADDWREPVGWRYFPNAYMRDNWQRYYA